MTIVNRMKFRNESVTQAAQAAVEDLARDKGIGGVIALDDQGRGVFLVSLAFRYRPVCRLRATVAMPLNCPGMYRGMVRGDGKPIVAIFRDDILA